MNANTRTSKFANGRWSRIRSQWQRIRESLFYLPSVLMVLAAVLAQGMVALDRNINSASLPEVFDSTVDSSRILLSVIAGGTITAASVVFSLTLVAVQLASTQYSPRILGSFLGDRAQQVIIGLVLGTFVYCLLVLRVVRAPVDEGGIAFVPRFSVAMAVVLGIASMVAVIASINRTAQSLRIESVAARIVKETMTAIGGQFTNDRDDLRDAAGTRADTDPRAADSASGRSMVIESDSSGWIQSIDMERIAASVPEGSEVDIHQTIGLYVMAGQSLASVWPAPEDPTSVAAAAASAFVTGEKRSRDGDIEFGIVQLTDIAERAMSPGINDPKTAEEIVWRLGDILVELVARHAPPAESMIDGRRLVRSGERLQQDYVVAAIEPIRRSARRNPAVLSTILRTLATSKSIAIGRRPDAAVEVLDRQAQLVLADVDLLPTRSDRELVRQTAIETGLGH